MKIKILYLALLFCSSFTKVVIASDLLTKANAAYSKNDFKTAYSLYKTAMNNLGGSAYSISSSPVSLSTPTSASATAPPSDSVAMVKCYACFQMGQCCVQMKNLSDAVSMFDMGAQMGGNCVMGNRCLYEKGFWQLHQQNYSGSYDSFNSYVNNIGSNSKSYDCPRAQVAMYYSIVNAVFLRDFNKGLAAWNVVKNLLPADKRLSFK
jgi:hypothetical protein